MAKISAFAIIRNEAGQVLLCHRRDMDLWNLPGGGVEENESPWFAAIREVEEEVGLIVETTGLLGIYHKPNHNELSFLFLCKTIGGEITLTSEADEIQWFSHTALPPNTSTRQMERIQDSVSFFGKPVLANQAVAFSRKLSKESDFLVVYEKPSNEA